MKKEPSFPKLEPSIPDVKPILTRDHQRTSFKTENAESDSDQSVASLVSSSSSGGTGDKELCPICLCSFKNQNSATPEVCQHKFCLECIEEWSKVNTILISFFAYLY